ncbi:vWA domain-containing protein [Pseudoalteromonas marina]|jgi:Ca-activated chloride channel family protein|uniref:vWA domain-containing protein n=1 Tax=Pseudoalteromonas marina TaxID=267375 RepID=UPI002304068E|nr:VWA domain-containing protein [Pseudoalteromonas marina]MDA8939132.1 VWA domain-containing protein [Pseudoalteromonas marina]
MFEFSWPWLFLLLPLPLLLLLLKPAASTNNTRLRIPGFAQHSLSNQSIEPRSRRLSLFEWLLWLLLVSAAANPTWLDEPILLPNEGRDIMLAVDLSGSMTEQDMAYNGQYVDRLTMVKAVLSDFIEQRTGDRLGLILFGDTAFLQTPLTRDLKTVTKMLNEAQIGLVGRATAIGDALGLSVKRFASKDDSNRIVVLLTDGQNTAGNLNPDDALLLAREEGIKVYTIGVGSDNPRGFSLFNMGGSGGSNLDERLLKNIADDTGGLYFRAKDVAGLKQIYAELDKLEPISADEKTFRPQSSLFYYPLLIAILLISLNVMLSTLRALKEPN